MATSSPNTPTQTDSPACPGCGSYLLNFVRGQPIRCPMCHWKGQLFVFSPPPRVLDEKPKEALAGEVTCAYHASKQAVKICAGTGNYICELCAVEVNGEIYSAEFLNQGGSKKLQEVFESALKRPDRAIEYLFSAGLLTLVLCWPVGLVLGPVLLVLALVQYSRYRKEITEHGLLERIVHRWRGIGFIVGFVFWICLYLLFGVGITLAILSKQGVIKL